MKNFVKFTLLAIVAVSASVASAADLEFHGYARVGLGRNLNGGGQVSFMLAESGKSKFRLGNEADWCLEPGFTMSFTKLDDKSAWGVHILPATYRRFNGDNDNNQGAPGNLAVGFKEFYFYGQNVPQLGGGEIWAGRRYFGRNYLGAINDSFLEAQDGVGAGVYDIPVGPAKLGFDISAPDTLNGGAITDQKMSTGFRVTGIPTFNKDSNLQIWGRVYYPNSTSSGPNKVDPKRKLGFSASVMHVAGFGAAGNLTLAGRFDQNAYTDQQDNGAEGVRNFELDAVYGVNMPSIRTSFDALLTYRNSKAVAARDGESDPGTDATSIILGGVRSDTQISGPFRFLLEVGVSTAKTGSADRETLVKVTPCFAISGGNDPWSRPTFRLFYTYASWNDAATASVTSAWKDSGADQVYGDKKSGSVLGIQAEGWW